MRLFVSAERSILAEDVEAFVCNNRRDEDITANIAFINDSPILRINFDHHPICSSNNQASPRHDRPIQNNTITDLTVINNGGQINQAPPIDPLLLQHQLRLQELERKKAEVAEQQAQARKRSPMLVYTQKASLKPQNAAGMPSFSSSDKGEQSSNAVLINAQKIQNQDYMIAQGTTISGVLETAIQSDLAGHLRAIVTRDIYSFDGSNILIPRGSKIIGQYQSNIKQGQSRLFVIWQRIIRPDGVDISLNSPGTDSLGRAGLGGEVDARFLERFGSAILLSMIDGAVQAGVNAASNTDAQTIVTSSGGALNNSAEIALKNAINIAPTIHVDQGTAINIFVTSDLDFSSTKPKRNNGSWWK